MTIEDETFETDPSKIALHEGIALQEATGLTAMDMEARMKAGDFIAIGAYVWLMLKFRLGRDITWPQIKSGEYAIDMAAITVERIDEPGPTKAARARARAATSKSAG
ncbi:hypothetical protein [Streptosporangium sp. CA-115845]|uniref:hypothetical protein n=1 Tax=Streptosporangium sp. CA-115845 TaxID=3240071 RepID=UPI003D8A725B